MYSERETLTERDKEKDSSSKYYRVFTDVTEQVMKGMRH